MMYDGCRVILHVSLVVQLIRVELPQKEGQVTTPKRRFHESDRFFESSKGPYVWEGPFVLLSEMIPRSTNVAVPLSIVVIIVWHNCNPCNFERSRLKIVLFPVFADLKKGWIRGCITTFFTVYYIVYTTLHLERWETLSGSNYDSHRCRSFTFLQMIRWTMMR